MTNLLFQVDMQEPEPESMPEMDNARIVVIGVGGGGGNTIDTMIERGIEGVEFVVANTDLQNLSKKKATHRIQLGAEMTRGLGAGARPEIGKEAAERSINEIAKMVKGADLVFITAGMGGGTGTGAAPVIARIAKEAGALAVAVVTKPFEMEGGVRMRNALQGVSELEKVCDTVLVIPNDRIEQLVQEDLPIRKALKISDQVLFHAVNGITTIITKHGVINVDFNDVRKVMENGGNAMMGAAICQGENRACRAMETAIESPLIEDARIEGARHILVNIAGAEGEISKSEIDIAMGVLNKRVSASEVETILGITEDPALTGSISVTLIASGFGQRIQHTISSGSWNREATGSDFSGRSISGLEPKSPAMIMDGSDTEFDIPAYQRIPLKNGNPYR